MLVIMFSPASIDWCEKNYKYSPYIAEFWNTITGASLCLSSLIYYLVYINNKTEYNKYIYNANFWLFIVGVGTILFHGSLLYIFQLLDEIPMLLIAIQYLKLNIKIAKKLNINHTLFHNGDLFVKDSVLIIFSIIFSYYLYSQFQSIIFLLSFSYSVYLIFFQMKLIQDHFYLKHYNNTSYKSSNTINIKKNLIQNKNDQSYVNLFYLKIGINHNRRLSEFHRIENKKYGINLLKKVSLYNKICIFLFVLSLIIWIGDSLFCKYFETFKLHAIWHILTSIALYLCNIIMDIHVRLIRSSDLFGDGI